jgi:hypothetical protein
MSYARLVLFLGFILPASAQDHSSRIFDQFTGGYNCGGRWTEFQFKIVPVTARSGRKRANDILFRSLIQGALSGQSNPGSGRSTDEVKRSET